MDRSGEPQYYIAIVLEPYGELVRLINSTARNDNEKFEILMQVTNKLMGQTNYAHLKELGVAVGEEVGVNFDYMDAAYWVWLTPSLQFL